jgi:hypothetical protein
MGWPYVSDDSTSLGSVNLCRHCIFKRFVPFFCALQKFHLVESPMEVIQVKLSMRPQHLHIP